MSRTDANAIQEAGDMRRTITDMDSMSQTGFSRVAAIAQLALAYLETPESYRFPERIARALEAIRDTANEAEDYINSMAEQAGCHYVSEREARRHDAQAAAREAIL